MFLLLLFFFFFCSCFCCAFLFLFRFASAAPARIVCTDPVLLSLSTSHSLSLFLPHPHSYSLSRSVCLCLSLSPSLAFFCLSIFRFWLQFPWPFCVCCHLPWSVPVLILAAHFLHLLAFSSIFLASFSLPLQLSRRTRSSCSSSLVLSSKSHCTAYTIHTASTQNPSQ